MSKKTFRGELVENRVVIWNLESSKKVFGEGYFGKPLGVPKPKGTDFDAPLILDLIEGYHLLLEKKIKIYDSETGKVVSQKRLKEKCENEYVLFKEKLMVYRELRDRGYIVTPGIKFGSDFAVYEHGPGIDHAPYIIQVMVPKANLTATGIVLAGRLATTVKKKFLIAIADTNKEQVEFLSFDWWRA
jgi:tRNA-intron endonuclease|tara:strand:- start:435 stop:995 length:561 start_codon:yes stop_codon:yes gene_type:complete